MITKKIILCGIILMMSLYVHGYFVFNTSCEAFMNGECAEKKSESLAPSVGQMIIDGAGAFLQSNSDYQLFLKKVELSGIDGANTEELLAIIDNAFKAMETANETYYQMVLVSNSLDYNPVVIKKLVEFDYSLYRVENGLNPSIFREVETLLKAGDVRGCYHSFFTSTRDILARLKAMKAVLETGVVPGIPSCWRLNQSYLEVELFGQYMAEVFITIK